MAKRSYFDSWRQNNTKSPRLGESAAAAATASTASAPTAQSMERDEEGDRDDEPQAADSTSANTSASANTSTSTAILATSTSTFQKRPLSSSSSSSSSSYSVYDELNARDDQDAPTAVLDAAKELRRRIHEGVEDGTGLVIHRFHIRKRGDEDKQKKRRGRPGKKDDHADWCVHCDVCNGRPTSILPSHHSNSPLYGFEQQHLNSQTHEKHGNAILSTVASVEETAALDDAAADAALNSQCATDKQQCRSPMYSESRRRDSVPVAPMDMVDTALAKLVADDPALLWVEDDGDDSHTVKQAACLWCAYTSKAAPDEAKLLSELMGHLKSKRHAFLREHGGGLYGAFGAASSGPVAAPPPPPDTSRLCWGFHKPEIEVNGKMMKMNALFNYNTTELDWYAEPNTRAEFQSTTEGMPPIVINGTFRSRKCARFCTLLSGQRLPNLSCLECSKIGCSRSLRLALSRKNDNESRDSSKVNFKVSLFEFVQLVCCLFELDTHGGFIETKTNRGSFWRTTCSLRSSRRRLRWWLSLRAGSGCSARTSCERGTASVR